MKTRSLLILIPVLFISCSRYPAPDGMMVELIREPEYTLIRDARPEFSWIVPSDLEYQQDCRILVATDPEFLNNNEADAWDSGKTESSNSTGLEYAGANLEANREYYWKVKVWGSNGKESDWSPVQKFRMYPAVSYQTTENHFIEKKEIPVNMTVRDEGHAFFDFGKAAFGRLVITVNPEKQDSIIVHLGEKSTGKNVDRKPGGSIRYTKVAMEIVPGKSSYKVPLVADPRNTNKRAIALPDSFGVIMPFRYVEIENLPDKLLKENLHRISYFQYFDDEASYFQSSDTLLNRIWELCKYSIKATSFAGLYVDGDRERIPYEADAYINMLGHYYTDREFSMGRRTNEYFIDNPTWPTEWILFTVPLFWEDYLHTGNSESILRFYNELRHKTLIALAREDGLVSVESEKKNPELMLNLGFENKDAKLKDIVDWPPANKDTNWDLATEEGERDGFDFRPVNTVVNSLHYYNLVLMSKIAATLGHENDSAFFSSQSEKVAGSIQSKLFDKEKEIFIDGEGSAHSSLHANMFPLAFGLVPDKYKDSVINFIKSRGMACSVYGAQFLLDGLYAAGEEDYALELLTATHDRSWWNMIRTGSTITMEAWDMKYKPNSDWNHAWGAAPANIIPRRLWGIRPDGPGFATAIIEPFPGSLEWSEIRVPTIRGAIEGKFSKEGNKESYKIRIPGNMKAEFINRRPGYAMIELNGESIKENPRVINLTPGDHHIIITLK